MKLRSRNHSKQAITQSKHSSSSSLSTKLQAKKCDKPLVKHTTNFKIDQVYMYQEKQPFCVTHVDAHYVSFKHMFLHTCEKRISRKSQECQQFKLVRNTNSLQDVQYWLDNRSDCMCTIYTWNDESYQGEIDYTSETSIFFKVYDNKVLHYDQMSTYVWSGEVHEILYKHIREIQRWFNDADCVDDGEPDCEEDGCSRCTSSVKASWRYYCNH